MVRAVGVVVALLAAAAGAGPAGAGGGPAAPGDFNGDGLPDLAVGVAGETVDGVDDAGAVQVVYAAPGALDDGPPGSIEDQFWSQGRQGLAEAGEADDGFGEPLASGDFDGDGHADLAVGVPGEDVGAAVDAGAVHVLYGGPDGLQASAPDDQVLTQDTPGVRGTADSADRFGSALAAADFDADGYVDLAVGVPSDDVGAVVVAGAVAVLYGSAAGLQADAPDDLLLTQDTPRVDDAAEVGDRFGEALAAGDLDGDGFADLAVGVPEEDVTVDDDGAVAVVHGSSGGLQGSAPADQLWHQDSAGVRESAEVGDEFGDRLAIGDFDGDGFGDLAVGVPQEDRSGLADSGVVAVLHGSAAGLQATAPDDQVWGQGGAGVRGIPEAGDRFGFAVSAGDFDGDGRDDLAVGIPYETVGGVAQTGAVAVLHGSPAGLQSTAPDDQLWHQDTAGVCEVATGVEHFGWVVLARDFTGDGPADLAIGAPYETIADATGSHSQAGILHVLYGTAGGLGTVGDQCIWQGGTFLDRYEADDRFAHTLG